jgi:hypothetical protein
VTDIDDRGHYDATAALAGQPFTIHQPEDCTPECLQYRGSRRLLRLVPGTGEG